MSAPTWIPILDSDIRKLPALVKRQRRKGSSTTNSASRTPPSVATSNSTPPLTDGQSSSPLASRGGDTSATSAPEFIEPPPLRAFRKKKKLQPEYPPLIEDEAPQRYWNEYDNPSEDEGYYIYLDPAAPVAYPGQEFFERVAERIKSLLRIGGGAGEEDPLLSGIDDGSTDDDETEDESPSAPAVKTYGTMSSQGYLSNALNSLRNPFDDQSRSHTIQGRSNHQRHSLLTEIELRQHEREVARLRLYCICLCAAVIIDVILITLTTTTRKKERGVADAVVLFGTICNLVLLLVGISTMLTRKERLGWLHQGTVCIVAMGVLSVDVLLLRWVLNP